MNGRKRAGAEVDRQWPRILKKLGSVGGAASSVVPGGVVPWSNVSKTGSSLAHIADRDHGLLTGLGDDDHAQYVHVSSSRTIAASHTWTGDQRFDGSVGIGVWPPTYRLEVGDRMRMRTGANGSAGTWLADAAGDLRAFVGLNDDTSANRTAGIWVGDWHLQVDAGGNTKITNSVRTNSFVSGFTGSGFRLDNGLTTAGKTTGEMDDLIVRGRMRVYELLVQQIRATNGSIFVSSTGKIKAVSGSGAGPYSIETETTHGFLVNDLARAQRFTGNGVYQSNIQITAVADLTHFTANLSSGDAPAVGMEFVRLGNTSDSTRQNSIYMSADDTYNPFIDLIVGVNSFAAWGSTSTRKGRIGNLQGLFGVANELGIFVGDGMGITNKYFRVSNVTQESHNIPNKMYDSGGNLFMQMDTTGLNFYVQAASSFADNTSVMFRRLDGTKIARVVGVNNFSSHTGAFQVEPGTANSDMMLLCAAPSGFFARTLIQATVGSSSSQWYFQRLADGTTRADFPGYLSLVGDATATTNHYGQIIVEPASQDRDCFISMRTTRTGTDRTWLIGCGSGAGNANFRIYDYTAGANRLIIDTTGKVGIGIDAPVTQLHVANSARIGISGNGLVQMSAGDASNIGYYEWYNPAGNRIAYMGFGATNLTLALESSSNLRVTGGQMWVGNSSDIGFGAKIQTDGNIWASGAITSAAYWQVAATTPPGAASGYCRVTLRSSDNALVAVMPSGNVRVLAVN